METPFEADCAWTSYPPGAGVDFSPVNVTMGTNAYFTAKTASGKVTVLERNLRSFQTGLCDDDANWAWWAVRVP